jgi:hypothetical protein
MLALTKLMHCTQTGRLFEMISDIRYTAIQQAQIIAVGIVKFFSISAGLFLLLENLHHCDDFSVGTRLCVAWPQCMFCKNQM